MDNIDSVGVWFEQLEKRNECCDILVGIYQDNKSLETRIYPHARYDGMSILLSYLGELDLVDPASHIPELPPRPVPGLPRQLLSYFIYLLTAYRRSPPRKVRARANGWPKQPVKLEKTRIAWRIFDEVHSKAVTEYAQGNINPYFLSKLIPHLEPIWANKDRKISVVIPVSLHNTLTVGQAPENRVSFIDIGVDESTTSENIKQQIRDKLQRNTHYANRIGYRFVHFLGAWFYDYILTNHEIPGGSNLVYSNLGNWSANARNAVFIIPPVFFFCPVGAVILSWGNKLSIGVQIHPHIKLDSNTLEDLLDKWSADLSNSNDMHYWASSRTTADLDLK